MRVTLNQFTEENRHPSHFAEVIETATTGFLAQCLDSEELNFPTMPPFGSWVKAQDEESGNTIFAIVTYATTTPIDAVHRARALGLSLEALREQQPQIFAMLKTEFRATIVGFALPSWKMNGNWDNKSIYQYLPPRPPQIHQAVYRADTQEIIFFSEKLDFLNTILQITDVPVDSLIAATIRDIYQLRQANREWLINIGRTLSILLKDDYDRLRFILSQIHFNS